MIHNATSYHLIIFLFVLIVLNMHLQAQDTPLTDDTNPRIAFIADVYRDIDSDIFILDLATGDFETISPHIAPDFNPAFSPDGQYLLFRSSRNSDSLLNATDVFLYDFSSRKTLNITNQDDSINILFPRWSQDGEYITFLEVSDESTTVKRLDIESLHTEVLLNSASSVSWLPNNNGIIFSSSDGEGFLKIFSMTFGEAPVLSRAHPEADLYDPLFSPDGSYLVYSLVTPFTTSLVVHHVDTSEEFIIGQPYSQLEQYTWSPDNHCLTYNDISDSSHNGVILYDLRTHETIELQIEYRNVSQFTWASNTTCDDVLIWVSTSQSE